MKKNIKRGFLSKREIKQAFLAIFLFFALFFIIMHEVDLVGYLKNFKTYLMMLLVFYCICIVHEGIHVVAAKCFNPKNKMALRKTKLGFKVAATSGELNRVQYQIMVIAPLVFFSFTLVFYYIFNIKNDWLLIIFMLNTSASAGDIIKFFEMFAYPKDKIYRA